MRRRTFITPRLGTSFVCAFAARRPRARDLIQLIGWQQSAKWFLDRPIAICSHAIIYVAKLLKGVKSIEPAVKRF
jgi:hypothetical protein